MSTLEALSLAARGDRPWLGAAVAIGPASHLVIALAIPRFPAKKAAARSAPATEIVDIELPPPPPPPLPPPPPPAMPETPSAPSHAAAPAAPARAAAVVTRKEDPSEPADFSNSIVVGAGTTYAGGTTASNGTSTHVVRNVAPSGEGTAPVAAAPPAGPDRSRKATLSDGAQWKCPFPPEADAAQVDSALVTIRIDIDATGNPKAVAVLTDPGNGFGREARRCALAKHWQPALDHGGSPIEGTATIHVRFDR